MYIERKAIDGSRIILDLFTLFLCFIVAVSIAKVVQNQTNESFTGTFLLTLGTTWIISAHFTKLYEELHSQDYSYELIIIIKNILIQAFAAIVFFFISKEALYPRTFVLTYSAALLILLSLQKYAFRKTLHAIRNKGGNLRNVLIVGAGEVGLKFYRSMDKRRYYGYRILGFWDNAAVKILDGKYLGEMNDLETVMRKWKIDDVIITLPNNEETEIEYVVSVCKQYLCRIRIVPDYFDLLSKKYRFSMFGNFPVISVSDDRMDDLQWLFLKRLFDIILCVFSFMLIFSWLWPIIFIVIKITSKGPALIGENRLGRKGKVFKAYKFRSTEISYEENNLYKNSIYDSEGQNLYLTKTSAFLRKTGIDLLPMFINVLLGEMSIVGPEPDSILNNIEKVKYPKRYMLRYLVKPGFTGWAQLNGEINELKDPCLTQRKIDYDLWYIENWSIWLDLQIVFQTVWNMLRGRK